MCALASVLSLFGSGAMQVARCLQAPLLRERRGRGSPLASVSLLHCKDTTLTFGIPTYCKVLQSSAKFCKVLFANLYMSRHYIFSAFPCAAAQKSLKEASGMPVLFSLSPTSAGALAEIPCVTHWLGRYAHYACAPRGDDR